MSSAGEIALELEAAGFFTNVVTTDVNGDIVANIVPRTNTVTGLNSIVGTAGELASATDINAIMQFNGTVAGGAIYYPDSFAIGSISGERFVGTTNLTSVANQCDFLRNSTSAKPVIPFYSNAGAILATYDALNFFSIDARVGTVTPQMATDGTRIVEVDASTVAHYLVAPYSTWAAYTTALHATNTAWSKPKMCNLKTCVVVDKATLGKTALIDTTADTVTLKDLPVGYTGSLAPIVSCPQEYTVASGPFAVLTEPTSTKVAVLLGTSNALATWIAWDLPAALGSLPIVTFTRDKVLIGSHASTVAYIANYDSVAGTISAWVTITLPCVASTNSNLLSSNGSCFVSGDGTLKSIYISTNGLSWAKTALPIVAAGLIPLNSVIYITDNTASSPGTGNSVVLNANGTVAVAPNVGVTSGLKHPPNMIIGKSGVTNTLLSFVGRPTLPQKLVTAAAIEAAVVNIAEGTKYQNITNATALTALTVNLPPNPVAGMEIVVRFLNAVTTVTFGTQAAPANQTINAGATLAQAVAAKQVVRFIYIGLDWMVG
jgi:hypothetical protein